MRPLQPDRSLRPARRLARRVGINLALKAHLHSGRATLARLLDSLRRAVRLDGR